MCNSLLALLHLVFVDAGIQLASHQHHLDQFSSVFQTYLQSCLVASKEVQRIGGKVEQLHHLIYMSAVIIINAALMHCEPS